ncbi:hypothetical protein D3C72_1372260 [compost metagenome]
MGKKRTDEELPEVNPSELGLPNEVAAKYELVEIQPSRYFIPGHGEFDFSTISLTQADRLFQEGCKYLKLKE